MLNAIQLTTMLTLQDNMNSKINPDWVTAGYAYLRAAMVESVEAIASTPYKWWKAGEFDNENIRTEIVDIVHFALSATIIEFGGDKSKAAEVIAEQLANNETTVRFDEKDYDITALD